MCGIAGILRLDGQAVDRFPLEAMAGHLAHRGPDGSGIAMLGPCALAHQRLAILDLPGGAQPMQVAWPGGDPADAATNGLTVVFNGEIYNHQELRQRLRQLGFTFRSDHSDTEVLLHGYACWGTELPRHLQGMFAFALWDAKQQRLLLCRDRIGKKPLFMHTSSTGGEIRFASLEAALLRGLPAGERPAVDNAALAGYLRLGYLQQQSLFTGIEELPAAHYLLIDAHSGKRQLGRYWDIPQPEVMIGPREAAGALERVLMTAIDRRLQADVPVGVFLSGGIDSSVIAALGQHLLRQRGLPPLRTFSVAMPDLDYDESAHAALVARAIGSEHRQLTADPQQDVMGDLALLMAQSGAPTADSSLLPTLWLSRLARAHVKVALAGDGGDELFAGYDRYRAMHWLSRHRWWLAALPRSSAGGADGRSRRRRLERFLHAARENTAAGQYGSIMQIFSPQQIGQLLGRDGPVGTMPLPDWPADLPGPLAAMRWDLTHYLPFDLLRKIDRAAMSVALEVRCPLLDTTVVELACHLPLTTLMPGGKPKRLLRQLAAKLLPLSIAHRRKQGFAIPIGRWLRSSLKEQAAQRLFSGSLTQLGLDQAAVETLWREHIEERADHSHRLFALLQLALWQEWRRGL